MSQNLEKAMLNKRNTRNEILEEAARIAEDRKGFWRGETIAAEIRAAMDIHKHGGE